MPIDKDICVDSDQSEGTCPECQGQGTVVRQELAPGWAARHNERVANYQGGPRPHMYNDNMISVTRTCPKCQGSGQA